jgi:membrane peptidoglycan carboxypeptidase
MRVYSYQPPKINSSGKTYKSKWPKKKLRSKPSWKKILTWTFRVFAVGVLLAALLFLYYAKDLPDPNKLLTRDVPESTKIFDRNGGLLYEIHGEYKRTQVSLDQISPNLKNATIAIEDKNFYNEGGISVTAMVRAAVTDILSLRKSQGASTITQQFVKNAILTDNKSWDRKIREIILSIAIDAHFSKDQILQLYLNEIPYGRNAYGAEAAAQSYFGVSSKDLSLAQSAYLAALVQAPTYWQTWTTEKIRC